jgi:DNA-binding transcriptional regulator YhcF (GntR family)
MQTKSEKIAEQLIVAINKGEYTSNMPSEQDLARLYGTTTVTAGKALNILRDRNIVRRVPRLGTFVNTDSKKPIRIWLRIPEVIIGEIKQALNRKFPHFEIEFSDDNNVNPLDGGFDIIRASATFPYSFSKHLKPFPDEMVKEYRDSGKFFPELVDIFCDHHVYYAMPILFSPLVLCYNKDIAKKLGLAFSPYDFSFDDFIKAARKVKDSPFEFITKEPLSWIRYILFRGLNTESSLSVKELGIKLKERIPQCLEIIKSLNCNDITAFDKGNSLFRAACRQQVCLSESKLNFDWDILPMPALADAKAAATGEFLTVLNSSQRQKDAFKIVKAFLDEDIQSIFARYKFGLPVMKSLIPDTLDSRKYRDDIFINEISHMATNNALNHELHTACLPLGQDFQEQKISAEQLCESVIEVFLEIAAAGKRREKAEQNYNFEDM